MPYSTRIPDSFIDLSADTPVLTLPPTFVLNDLGPSTEFDAFKTNDTTLDRGDNVYLVDADGNPVDSGQFAGTATLSTAAADASVIGLASATVQVNPITGPIYVDENGQAYMITDEPLSADRLGVTITIDPLIGPDVVLNTPISGIADALPLGLGGLLTPITNAAQATLDTGIVTYDYDPDGTAELEPGEVVPCFARGTLIETPEGPVAVEDLAVGTLVRTRDNGDRPIRWIGRVTLSAKRLAMQPRMRPIRIAAGALGANLPSQPLVVSPQHRILVRSGIAQRMFGSPEVLVAARQLLLLEGIDIAEDLETVEYFHILFDQHEIVISNGAETESLYTGPQALRGVGRAAREEIFALFPELEKATELPPAARDLASGRMARKLAMRHQQNRKPLVSLH
ncbi:Hint domain-containing protein [Paracoccus benzoatiresistens]|uniref:Hint domain-containing protein n=1 Tax=Paracoccus benzoatiresistens TaxID=2997341 RepID=A0ABT4J8C3_9RHOB|nr:Hint domain-containing protein [Paracoccus sp. EF6]MCZ0962588.1 Hint domain-containing protein [Paracoccus sp. EF6]